jgi:hypothetical protein
MIPNDGTPPPDPRGWPSAIFVGQACGRPIAWVEYNSAGRRLAQQAEILGFIASDLTTRPRAGTTMEVEPIEQNQRRRVLRGLEMATGWHYTQTHWFEPQD